MLKHDISIYENDPYLKENTFHIERYVELIDKYSLDKGHILEFGIGHAQTAVMLPNIFKKTTILDGDAELVGKYSEKLRNINFVETYFENYIPENESLPYKNIGMGFILEHVDNPEAIINKYSKYLDEDGMIFVGVPNASSLHRLIANKAGLLDDISLMSDVDKKFGHLRFLTYKEWLAMFARCNMEVVASHGLFMKPFTTKQIESLNLSDVVYNALAEVALEYPEISNACFFALKIKESV